jgi:TonB-linked SusC/RagA family outer membrane protein
MKTLEKKVHVRYKFVRIAGMLALASLMLPAMALAQEKVVTGTVSSEQEEAIAGATVVVKGSSRATMTDVTGSFSISAAPSDVLRISFLGYQSSEVAVGNQDRISVILKRSETALEEVVAIGYGSVKKANLTGAVSKMGSQALEDRSLARAESALQGQLAGVTVRTVTGEPGEDMQIRVRGAASINANSDPLYVVDGVPLEALTGVNPADIESVEVLKDAASAAIYGSRGNNGVVIVTTRRGKSGKPSVSVNASYGIQSLEKKMDNMSAEEWIAFNIKAIDYRYLNQAKSRGITNAGIGDDVNTRLTNVGLSTTTWGNAHYTYVQDPRWFKYVSADVAAGHNIQIPGIDPDEALSLLDWQEEFYREAPVRQLDVSVSGGSENTSYMFSAGLFDQEGIATGTGYDRYSFRANIESQLSKYVTAGLQLAPTYLRRDGSGRANGKDTRAHHVLSAAPVSEPGVGYRTNVEPNTQYLWSGTTASPIAFMENIRHDDMVRMMGNAFLRISPLSGLKVELSGATNYYDLDGQTYTFSSTGSTWTQGEGANSSGGHNTQRRWSTLLQALASYDKTFDKHTVGLMAGASTEQFNIGFSTDQTFNKPFPNDAVNYSFDESTLAVGNSNVTQYTPSRLVSYFGRAMYNYDEKYLLSASLRRDGGSVFGANNKWGWFPAASLGWVVSNEGFFKNLGLGWWNMLKIRASYGVTGNNQISNTAAYATLASISYAGLAGYNANSLGNADLGWEKSHSTDLALDLGFLKNRVQLSLDWYTKNTTDLLYQVPSLGASGFSTVWDNLGDIRNTGFEVELNTHNIAGKDFSWTTSFNLSYNENEVLSLGVDDTPIYSGFDSGNPSNVLQVGEPINAFYMYNAIGIWRTQQELDDYAAETGVEKVTFEGKELKPGDLRYEDVNHDGVLDLENDRKILGSPVPKFTYGMTNRITYKDFDLSILITAQSGGKIFGVLGRAIDRPSMNPNSNMMDVWTDAWWSESEQGSGDVPSIFSATTGGRVDSRWLWSSNYLRIKNLTFGYKLPIPAKFVQSARVYLSIENLWKWDKYYNGYSPEAANTASSASPGGTSAVGLDYGGYPISRIFSFGLNLNF